MNLTTEGMVHNKIVLLGDAAFISRPQTAADALTLDDALANVKSDDKFK